MQEFTIYFSNMFREEGWLAGEAVDMSDINSTNCFCDESSAMVIRNRLSEVDSHAIHWIDSGDYHYATLFFLEKLQSPFNLLLIDNHSDDFETGTLNCGNWVSYARLLPHYREVSDSSLPLYISLDLDILPVNEFSTNWDQGRTSLLTILETIRNESLNRRIAGIDICGGLTRAKGACDCQLENNRKTREIICEYLRNSVF